MTPTLGTVLRYSQWKEALTTISPPKNLRDALDIQELIYVKKPLYLQSSQHQSHHHFGEALPRMMKDLQEEIARLEEELLRPIGLFSRTLFHSGYYSQAKGLVDAEEQALNSYQLGWLSTPLAPQYLAATKVIVAAGFLGLDGLLFTQGKVPHHALQCLSQLVIPRGEKLMQAAKLDAVKAAQLALFIDQSVRAIVFVAISLCFSSMSWKEALGVYTLSWLITKHAGKSVDFLYRTVYGTQDRPTQPLVKTLVQWTAPILGARLLLHAARLLSTPQADGMSWQQVCAIFNIPSNATAAEARYAYRSLVRLFHPDQPSGNRSYFELLNRAIKHVPPKSSAP